MAEAVRCDVCGKLFNSSRLKAHKRLAHERLASERVFSEEQAVETIVGIYKKLSVSKRREVHTRLTGVDGK